MTPRIGRPQFKLRQNSPGVQRIEHIKHLGIHSQHLQAIRGPVILIVEPAGADTRNRLSSRLTLQRRRRRGS